MPAPIRITQEQRITPSIGTVTPSRGGQRIAESFANFAGDMGEKIAVQAEKKYMLHLDAMIKKDTARIERENMGDPDAMQKAYSEYTTGLVSTIPSNQIASQVESQLASSSQPAINRALKVKQMRIDNEVQTQILLNLDQNESQVYDLAPDLFSDIPNVQVDAAMKMQGQMINSMDLLNSNKSDGTPMFSPEQKAARIQAARDGMYKATASTWMATQEDKAEAYGKWLNNELEVSFPTEDGKSLNVNVRDTLPALSRRRLDKEFAQQVKDEITIEKAAKERAKELAREQANAVQAEFFEKIETASLSLEEVEQHKNLFLNADMLDRYSDLREMAITADPISDGNIYSDLVNRALSGEDVWQEARARRFIDKKLSNKHFKEIISIIERKQEQQSQPFAMGQRFVRDYVGGSARELDELGSQVVANANADYILRYEQLTKQLQRQPTTTEVIDLGRQVGEAWAIIDDRGFATMEKPQFMPMQIKIGRKDQVTPEAMQQVKNKTIQHYARKYAGDKEQMKNDPELLRQLKLIQDYNRVLGFNKGGTQ